MTEDIKLTYQLFKTFLGQQRLQKLICWKGPYDSKGDTFYTSPHFHSSNGFWNTSVLTVIINSRDYRVNT